MKIIGEVENFTAFGINVGTVRIVQKAQYHDGTPVVDVMCYDQGYEELFARLTVCVTGSILQDGEYLVRTWSENEWAHNLLEAGLFEDTGKRVATGYCNAEVWRLKCRH